MSYLLRRLLLSQLNEASDRYFLKKKKKEEEEEDNEKNKKNKGTNEENKEEMEKEKKMRKRMSRRRMGRKRRRMRIKKKEKADEEEKNEEENEEEKKTKEEEEKKKNKKNEEEEEKNKKNKDEKNEKNNDNEGRRIKYRTIRTKTYFKRSSKLGILDQFTHRAQDGRSRRHLQKLVGVDRCDQTCDDSRTACHEVLNPAGYALNEGRALSSLGELYLPSSAIHHPSKILQTGRIAGRALAFEYLLIRAFNPRLLKGSDATNISGHMSARC
ncbi:hypothetical protein LguiA_005412 [Lonicera macranthoides]